MNDRMCDAAAMEAEEVVSCVCGATRAAGGMLPWGHGIASCHVGGIWRCGADFARPVRDLYEELAAMEKARDEAQAEANIAESRLKDQGGELRRVRDDLIRWKSLAQAACAVVSPPPEPETPW